MMSVLHQQEAINDPCIIAPDDHVENIVFSAHADENGSPIKPAEDTPVPNSGIEWEAIPVYGSFALAGSEFALSARYIQEVVNEPAAYSPVPLSPDYLLGIFNLRGSIIPVLDLRKIFRLKVRDDEGSEARKVAIVEYGELCLGLLFDSTGEVFNSNHVEYCAFVGNASSTASQVIAGVFKMDGGTRIVQNLDVNGMLQLDSVPHSKSHASARHRIRRGTRHQCISFLVDGSCCALDIGAIKEIVNIGAIENTVLASDLCHGAIEIRGDTVPVVSLSYLFGSKNGTDRQLHESDPHRVIVLNIENNLLGLLVDSIQDIVSYFDDELIAFPALAEKKRTMFSGCIPGASDGNHTILLKHDELLSSEELAEITQGHSNLFRDSKENFIRERKVSLDRKTLITFSLDNRYGLDISEVKEVINYPTHLVKAPNMAEHIRGMVNLRGELVTVVDSRKLYDLKPSENDNSSKVLVYERNGVKQGLVVDSVDSIIPFNRADVMKVPGVLFKEKGGQISNDVQEAIMFNAGDQSETVCILDLDAVSNRLSA